MDEADPSRLSNDHEGSSVTGKVVAALAILLLLLAVAWLVPVVPLDRNELTVTFGDGRVLLEGSDGSTLEAQVGMTVRSGGRIIATDGATVSLDAADGHHVTLTDSAVVTVGDSRGTLIGNGVTTRIDVPTGVVRVGGEARSRASMEIGLPNGVAGVRGTEFGVDVRGELSAVSIHEGRVSLGDVPGEAVELEAGSGALVREDGAEVRALPPATEILRPPPGTVVRTPDVLLEWTAVRGATQYLAEFATDPAFQQVRHRPLADGPSVQIPLLEVDGPVYARVFVVTEEGLRGMPSPAHPLGFAPAWASALALRESGQLGASIAAFEEARARYGGDVEFLRDMAWTHYVRGAHQDARDVYEEAASIAPEHDELIKELARVHYWLGEYTRAEERYRSVLDRNPNDPDALWGLGDTYRMMGRRTEAIELVQRALREAPDHPYARITLSQLRGGD